MKRFALLPLLTVLMWLAPSFSQTTSDPYKATLDKLQSLTIQGESEWRYHADIPHPEDPGVSDSDWGVLTVKNVSGPGGDNPNEEHWTGRASSGAGCRFRRRSMAIRRKARKCIWICASAAREA